MVQDVGLWVGVHGSREMLGGLGGNLLLDAYRFGDRKIPSGSSPKKFHPWRVILGGKGGLLRRRKSPLTLKEKEV